MKTEISTRLNESDVFDQIGCEEGCLNLSRAFYLKVGKSDVLKPLFPGKSLRCAIEEFSAFLVMLFDGDESHCQYRWWLSLRDSHARFQIQESQRLEWLRLMLEAIQEQFRDNSLNSYLVEFFQCTSIYIVTGDSPLPPESPLAATWSRQLLLDQLVQSLCQEEDEQAIHAAQHFRCRRTIFIGILARFLKAGRPMLMDYAVRSVLEDQPLIHHRFNGRTLLHHSSGAGSPEMVKTLLDQGADPNELDSSGHPPLYRACGRTGNPEVIQLLVKGGADPNLRSGVMKATALHEAQRFKNQLVVDALLDWGADPTVADARGRMPMERGRRSHK